MRMGMDERCLRLVEKQEWYTIAYDHCSDKGSILARRQSCERLSLLLLVLRFNFSSKPVASKLGMDVEF